jgi:cell wall-associated NlpC family hydrolase
MRMNLSCFASALALPRYHFKMLMLNTWTGKIPLLRRLCAVWALTCSAHAAPLNLPPDALGQLLQDKGIDAPPAVPPQVTLLRTTRSEPADGRAPELLVHALGFLDIPYQWGGTSPATGFDCSGFVQEVYRQSTGLVLPRQTDMQAQATEEISPEEMQPGDLVFFNTMRRPHSHVGIYVGEQRFIHAPTTGAYVRMESMGESYWQTRLDGVRRVSLAALLKMLD